MMKLKAINPITGNNMDLSVMGIISMIIGVVVLFFIGATGQKVARMAEQRAPLFDTSPEPLWRQEMAVQPKQKRVYI
jgi:hypothetical protein